MKLIKCMQYQVRNKRGNPEGFVYYAYVLIGEAAPYKYEYIYLGYTGMNWDRCFQLDNGEFELGQYLPEKGKAVQVVRPEFSGVIKKAHAFQKDAIKFAN